MNIFNGDDFEHGMMRIANGIPEKVIRLCVHLYLREFHKARVLAKEIRESARYIENEVEAYMKENNLYA